MGRIDFNKLPINTLIGASWRTFKNTVKDREIGKKFRAKYMLTLVVCRILSIFVPIQNRIYRKRVEKKELANDPLFIIGHWRSGTTFVHNVLAKDKRFGYTTTYQTVFPHIVLWGQSFFKKTMASIMPDKRPADNMELSVDLPQEEEFALSNMTSCNYYNFWFLPKYMREYADKYLTFKSASAEEKQEFSEQFKKLVKISMENTGGVQYLSKNPPHTARVAELLEIYPNAKFIYLMRNPYTVLESTRNFFYKTIKPLMLHDLDIKKFDEDIIEVYKEVYFKYEKDKNCIPEGNLIEMKFEDFEADPSAATKLIYDTLSLEGYEDARSEIEAYLNTRKGYKKNKYKYAQEVIESVETNWKFAVKQWGYDIEGAEK